MNTDDIGSRARTAAGWQFLSKGINTALQIVTSIVLARLLMPADFGIVALATMVAGLAGIFQDIGLGQALVQRRVITSAHTRSAFWGTLLMGASLCALVVLTAPWVGAYFDEPRMVPVLRVISLAFILSPFAVVPRSLLQRNIDFRKPFFAGLVGSVAYGAVGITMALMGCNYWSLVGASLASVLGNTVALCILTRYIPPFVATLRGIGDIYGFGLGATGVGLMNYLAQQVDYFVIGRWLDSAALGLYTRAFTITHIPLTMIGGIVSPVLFPVFSRLSNQRQRSRDIMGKALTAVATLALPSLALLAVTAPELIPLVLGQKWSPAVVPTQILAAAGALRALANPAAMLPKGFGAIHSQVWRNGVYAATLFGGAVVCSRWGIVGVAWAAVFATVVIWALNAQLLHACSGFGLRDYAQALWSPVVMAALLMLMSCLTRNYMVAKSYDPWFVLGATIAVGITTVFAVLWWPCKHCRIIGRDIARLR